MVCTYKNNALSLPSVGGSSSKQVYCFFICLRGVFDCVCEKVDARNSVQFAVFSLQKIVLLSDMASAFSQMQLLGSLWQMKKRYSCWPFDFVGAGHCFIGILNLAIKVVSDGLHSQKQCIIIPSVGGSSSKQGYCFFICLRGVFDCVCEKVDARNTVNCRVDT